MVLFHAFSARYHPIAKIKIFFHKTKVDDKHYDMWNKDFFEFFHRKNKYQLLFGIYDAAK